MSVLDAGAMRSNSRGRRADPGPLLDLRGGAIDFDVLDRFAGHSIVHPKQFDRAFVVELACAAALLEASDIEMSKPLDGKIAITAFFEASTRTRLSFESAMLRLDGKVLSVPDGRVTGIAKGESLADIGEMFNTYGDIVVMRHPKTEGVDEILRNLQLPLINAGNGSGQHPTQALLDWYAILKWRPELALEEPPRDRRIHLGIVGTPGSMRAVRSFLRVALLFHGAVRRITIVSEMMDPLGTDLEQAVNDSRIPVDNTNDLSDVVGDLDAIYMNSIALLGDAYRQLGQRFQLDARSPLKPGAVIMHPLARRDELDESLDDTEHNLYFAQAAGAVFSRQALLLTVFGRASRLTALMK